jgi:hypothetical protein
MLSHRYPTLFVAALAATLIGTAAAQTPSSDTSRMPANKGMSQADQTQPSQEPTDKMKGQESSSTMNQNSATSSQHEAMSAQNSESANSANGEKSMHHHAMNTHKNAKHAWKTKESSEQAAAPDEKAYRQALRDCAKQENDAQRSNCLDGAIERFHRNA